MIELYFINAMMPAGGILVIDDTLMPSVAATITYIEANLPYLKVKINERFVAFVKWRPDKRSWAHYAPFYANFTNGYGKHRIFVKNVAVINKQKPPQPAKSQQPGLELVQATEEADAALVTPAAPAGDIKTSLTSPPGSQPA